MSSFAEGTIICKDPLTTNVSKYLNLLLAADDELSEAMKLNCKLARVFHSKVVTAIADVTDEDMQQVVELKKIVTDKQPHFVLLAFEALMKGG